MTLKQIILKIKITMYDMCDTSTAYNVTAALAAKVTFQMVII